MPPDFDLISADVYAGYKPGSNGTDEVAAAKAVYEGIFSKLHGHQKVLLVPGVFGCSNLKYFPLAAQEKNLVDKLTGYFEWAKADTRISGFNPWHFSTRKKGHAPPCDMELGPGGPRKERKVLMPSVMAKLEEIGKYIIMGHDRQQQQQQQEEEAATWTSIKTDDVAGTMPPGAIGCHSFPAIKFGMCERLCAILSPTGEITAVSSSPQPVKTDDADVLHVPSPSWSGQQPCDASCSVSKPGKGFQPIPNTTYHTVYQADQQHGEYSLGPQPYYFDGLYLVSWYNSPLDEDKRQHIVFATSSLINETTAATKLFKSPNLTCSNYSTSVLYGTGPELHACQTESFGQCCTLCVETPGCRAWDAHLGKTPKGAHNCWLHANDAVNTPKPEHVSGRVPAPVTPRGLWSAPAELFPSVSKAGTLAEPWTEINGALYAFASLGADLLDPNDNHNYLLARRVTPAGGGKSLLGPIFWATRHPPAQFAHAFPLYTSLSSDIGRDIAQLLGSLLNEFVEIHPPAECAKLGVKGCDQSNERSVFYLPGSTRAVQLVRHENQQHCPALRADGLNCSGTFGPKAYPTKCPASCLIASTCNLAPSVGSGGAPLVFAADGVCRPASGCWHGGLLPKPQVGAAVASQRQRANPSEFGQSCKWTAPVYTNIPDSPSRTCAATLPNGAAYLLSNPGPGRDPLVLSIAADGLNFSQHWLVITADAPLGRPEWQRCRFHKKCDSGYQYPSALWRHGDESMLVFYSINKEDIGFAKVKLKSLMTTAVKGDEVSAQSLKSDDLDLRGRGYRAASPTRPQFQNSYKMRGLRWAVNFPAAAEPFLLGENPGAWANTTRSVAQATVGIVVGPAFSSHFTSPTGGLHNATDINNSDMDFGEWKILAMILAVVQVDVSNATFARGLFGESQ